MKKLLISLIFLLLSFTQFVSAGNRWRPYEYQVKHYKIEVSFDIPKGMVFGKTTLQIVPVRDQLDTLRLQAFRFEVSSVQINGKNISNYAVTEKEILLPFEKPIRAEEEFTVVIAYSARPQKGIYFFTQDSQNPYQQLQMWSQGQGMDNHHWFPAWDYPNQKATFELIATVDSSLTAIGNGELVSFRRENDKSIYHYRFDQPSVSYLISLIVGKYRKYEQKYKNIPVEYFVYPGHSEEETLRSFGRTPDMLDFFSRETGYEYPYSKYTQTLITNFMYSGMENITASTMTDRTMHDERAHLNFQSDGLVAHELAHQWYGDLITCRDWSDSWLNEGFATYYTHLYMRHWKGDDYFHYRVWRQSQQPVIKAELKKPRTLAGDRPWGVYIKGSSVLHMLRQKLGPDLYRKGIAAYTRKFAFATAESADLRKTVEDVTGFNLYTFFQQWVYGHGIPEFKISKTYNADIDSLILTVEQTQDSSNVRPVFTVSCSVGVEVDGSYAEFPIRVTKRLQTFRFYTEEKPSMVVFDAGQDLLKKVDFEKPLAEWFYQLKHGRHLTDKIVAMDALIKIDEEDQAVIIAGKLLEVFKSEEFFGLRLEAAEHLSEINGLREEEKKEIAGKLWESIDAEENAEARKAMIAALGSFPAPGNLISLSGYLESDQSYDCQVQALNSLCRLDSINAENYITLALGMDSWDEKVREAAIKNLENLSNEEAVPIAEKYVTYGIHPKLRRASVDRLIQAMEQGDNQAEKILLTVIADANEHNRYKPVSKAVSALSKNESSREDLLPLLKELEKRYLNRYIAASVKRALKSYDQ